MRDDEEEFTPLLSTFPWLRGGMSSAPGRKMFPGAGNISQKSIEFSTGITQKGTHF